MPDASPPASLGRWVPSPRRGLMLVAGLWLFGTGEGLLVHSGLGNSPWTVLAEGLGSSIGLSVGVVTIILGAVVLLLWIPLRQRPGLGTIGNVILVGIALDVTLAIAPDTDSAVLDLGWCLLGIATVALGSGLYLGAALGPGPRDGLMTGLHRVTGWPLAPVRWIIELSILAVGFILGGTVGVGTILFAILIGPLVGVAVRTLALGPTNEL
ncbi:YczE/YyaS/YitT family protein [Gordonia soli]|uniref:Integral membrane protein n=1 Tax=Gordonia soli NBRC 108243 TaxID=1223545 RepID=M0QPM2_9ACTN|nr:membrane protein [Gordonia soli]GAC70226.1 hypothetical protein GS4_33_00400 [Gordonia soli NBRC 108243]